MATNSSASTKRSLINKANSTMFAVTAVAAFVIVFALVSAKALVGQAAYQNRVISGKKTALNQLKADLNARDSLVSSYKAFVDTSQNVLGGNPSGGGDQDGDNAKITLDALPSKYDFPALATSLEKILTGQNLQIVSIKGTDDEVAQSNNQSSGSPKPVAMPFEIQVSGSYQSIQNLVGIFGQSIRPFQIQTMELSGDQNSMVATIDAQTFYQPEKSLNIGTKVVK
jgi:Tfp pilus assembly protein PilO